MKILYFHEFIETLEAFDKKVQRQIKSKLKELRRTPMEQHAALPLKGPQFRGLHKLRVGDWRLIHKIATKEIHFITLGHRSEVYRK